MTHVQLKCVNCKQGLMCLHKRGISTLSTLGKCHLNEHCQILYVDIRSHFKYQWLSLMPTVPVAVHWNFCLLCIWTAFYQGVMWCMPISINTTPPGGDVEAQHFSQLKVPKPFLFSVRAFWGTHCWLVVVFFSEFLNYIM